MILLEADESDDSLIDARILANNWHEYRGAFVYSLGHIHPDWGRVTQTYDPYTTNYEGERVYDSEFLLFRKDEDKASVFSNYSKDLKIRLWKTIFAIKRRFFEEYNPAEVHHLIKQPNSVANRLPIYQRNLILPDYTLLRDRQTIKYIRNT